MTALNETHDPALQSWVESANEPDTDFPIQNLPFGVFSTAQNPAPRVGVAIGDQVLDVAACAAADLLEGDAHDVGAACAGGRLNELMAMRPPAWSALRLGLSRLLVAGSPRAPGAGAHLVPRNSVVNHLPAAVGDYTDFYASIHHATNVGSMFRPDQPLLPNYKYVPIGYHGRSSSLIVSGTAVRRPWGQVLPENATSPVFVASRLLDYELEVGVFVGNGTRLGEPCPIGGIRDHMFGLCLVNDWSARDVQKWEYQPLGPFLSKNFATSLSPWVVTMEALAPFRTAPPPRPGGDPAPLPHLAAAAEEADGAFDITLEVHLASAAMRQQGRTPVRLSRTNFREMYWTFGQMLAHHSSNGCNLRPGDLIASGTVSGPDAGARGCLLELTWRGTTPLTLPDGEVRRFLEDGDEVVMRGVCRRAGRRSIGFGECTGIVLPALS